MNEKLKEYFEKIESENDKTKTKNKELKLLKLKLIEVKELSDAENNEVATIMEKNMNYEIIAYNKNIGKYVEYKWNSDTHKYDMQVPIAVTEEEYNKLLELDVEKDNIENTINQEGNGIANLFKIIGFIIFIVGAISGFVLGKTGYEFNMGIAFALWFGMFLSGMFYIGIGEIIKLLHQINKKN